jgi:hypothetical protein
LRLKDAFAPLREISASNHSFLAKAQRISKGAKRKPGSQPTRLTINERASKLEFDQPETRIVQEKSELLFACLRARALFIKHVT